MDKDLALALDLLKRSEELRHATISAVTPLAGDMSTRRFCRVTLKNSPVASLIMVFLSGAPGPVGGGSRNLTQDDTYVEVGSFLSKHGVRVPKLFVDGRDVKVLLVEDIGDTSLLAVTLGGVDTTALHLGEDPLYTLYSRALDIKKKLISLPQEKQCVIFERKTTSEQRAKQIREFLDHYAIPRGLTSDECLIVEQLMNTVCSRVEAHPLQVSHFDFMASNIHVLSTGELCLIDFQDMCLDSPARDIVSLLNDRDSDSALGKERQKRLLTRFMREVNTQPNFQTLYDDYLLLWDFRVSGRFALLSDQRGIERYRTWIPGTLRRLGRTLVRCKKTIPHAEEALAVLTRFSPFIKEGREDPWEFPEEE